MRKGKIILCILVPILLLLGGWVLFNQKIRPNHYQLLFPYTTFFGKRLAVTETRMGADGRVQIRIPAGEAIVGKDEYETVISPDDYWIDQIPVTAGAYKRFLMERKILAPRYHDEYARYWLDKKYDALPVVFVSWGQAEVYCEHYGGHLPTEAQWEKAARGPEGIVLYWDDSGKAYEKANYDNFFNGLTPAGWLPKGKTYYGVLDMSGNVREWVLDWMKDEDQPVRTDPWEILRDEKNPGAGRILKGGSFSDDLSHLRLNFRDAHDPNSPGLNRGFRCVFEDSQ